MKLQLGKRALRHVERKEAWWAENRPAAPDLFARAFRDTLEYLRTDTRGPHRLADTPTPDPSPDPEPRTQDPVFLVVDETAQTIDVLAFWGAVRERAPKL